MDYPADAHPSQDEIYSYIFCNPSRELIQRIEEHVRSCSECALAIARTVRQSVGEQGFKSST